MEKFKKEYRIQNAGGRNFEPQIDADYRRLRRGQSNENHGQDGHATEWEHRFQGDDNP